jgi:hypothetical protein
MVALVERQGQAFDEHTGNVAFRSRVGVCDVDQVHGSYWFTFSQIR